MPNVFFVQFSNALCGELHLALYEQLLSSDTYAFVREAVIYVYRSVKGGDLLETL